jgi:hypothetical protein
MGMHGRIKLHDALLIPGPSLHQRILISSWNLLSKSYNNFGRVSGQSMLFRVKKFKLRVAVLWCIHDYPTLSMLCG